MATRPDSELSLLRQQMSSLKPGVLDGAAEAMAPFVTKVLGYAELAGSLLPQLRAVTGHVAPERRPATPLPPPAPAPVRRSRWARWRGPGLVIGASLCAGLAAWSVLKATPAGRRWKHVPPG